MFPYAASNNLRLIAIHSREYCGSTPFLEQELELLHSSDLEDQANYVSSQAIDIARLIAHCIKHDNLPPPTESQGVRSGGVCLFAWSAGSAVSLALLANLTKLEESIYTLLDRYITTIILHGTSLTVGCHMPTADRIARPPWLLVRYIRASESIPPP